MNETISNINLAGTKETAIGILTYIHSGVLAISTFIAKYISVQPAYVYLALFGLISLWLGSKVVDYRTKKVWWLVISAIIMYLLVWWK